MKMKLTYMLAWALLWLGLTGRAFAQDGEYSPDHSYRPLRLNLNDEGSKYLRLMLWNQVWVRSTGNNPGTTNIQGEDAPRGLDVGFRRIRLMAYAQVSPRFLILTHWGINNQSFNSGKKPQLFVHDAWSEYAVVDGKLHIGAGLHYWHGLSRMTSASTITFMALDAPIFNWPNIEMTDQFARQFGVYAKGALGRLHYQVAVNKPFAVGAAKGSLDGTPNLPAQNLLNDRAAFQGYFDWQFFEQEAQLYPFRAGTYMAGKKVLNLGAGFYVHPGSTVGTDARGREQVQDMRAFAVDLFANLPVGKERGTAFTGYAAYYRYDFGGGYLRHIGIMNNAYGGSGPAGAGNRQPTIGSGGIFYTQMGYCLPYMGNHGQFMPFGAFTMKDFEALDGATGQFDLGINYFLNGHAAKITLQHSTRPVYGPDGARDGSRGEWILQFQTFL
jgi:hypothetical protein